MYQHRSRMAAHRRNVRAAGVADSILFWGFVMFFFYAFASGGAKIDTAKVKDLFNQPPQSQIIEPVNPP